jgi:hypothetical protein
MRRPQGEAVLLRHAAGGRPTRRLKARENATGRVANAQSISWRRGTPPLVVPPKCLEAVITRD